MKRVGVGLSVGAVVVLSIVACASEEIDQTPLLGSTAGRAGSGGTHVGTAGRGGSSSSSTAGAGSVSQAGTTTGSVAGAPSNSAGAPSVGSGGLVGTSGSVGQGGSSGAAASGGSGPVFESGTCASSPTMSLSYQQASSNPKQITGRYQFSNTTNTPIPLAQLKIRYFFSNEETSGWATAIYDAKLDGGTDGYRAISGAMLAISPLGTTVPGADSYLELSFTSALSIEKGAIGTVSWDLQPHSYNPPDQVQTDDYSYNAAAVAYTVWDHVVIYQGNTLVWGCTPKEAGGTAGAGGVGGGAVGGGAGTSGTGGTSGGAGTSGSGAGGADNGGASGAGTGGTAGVGAGAGGDMNTGGTVNAGAGGALGGAGSNLGGAGGSAGTNASGSAGTSGSNAGNGGSSGAF